jgi:hypothetical protein
MSSITSSWRKRRQSARARRDLEAALRRSTSPAMRDELLTIAAGGQFYSYTRGRPAFRAARRGPGLTERDPGLLRGDRGRMLSGAGRWTLARRDLSHRAVILLLCVPVAPAHPSGGIRSTPSRFLPMDRSCAGQRAIAPHRGAP